MCALDGCGGLGAEANSGIRIKRSDDSMNQLRILVVAALLISVSAVAGADASDSTWEPRTTWVFAVSCTVYKLDKTLNLPKMGRDAVGLVDVFRARGVPENHIVFLQDKEATLAEIKRS